MAADALPGALLVLATAAMSAALVTAVRLRGEFHRMRAGPRWTLFTGFIGLFLAGYAALTGWAFAGPVVNGSLWLAASVFFLGALFVLLTLRLMRDTARDLRATSVSRDHLDAILSHMRDGVLVLSPGRDRILDANAPAAALLGVEREALPGMRLSHLAALTGANLGQLARDAAAPDGGPREVVGRTLAGERLDGELSAAPLRLPDGEGLVCVLRDARERRAAEEARALERENRRLRDVDRMKTQFLNTASHELSTPLTPVLLQVHMLRERMGRMEDGQRRAITILDRNLRRLAALVRDLLDVARFEHGRLALERKPVDLAAVVEELCAEYEAMANDRGVALACDRASSRWVVGDARRLHQALGNLLHNALKFTPRGGAVRVALDGDDGHARVTVTDTGPGLDAAQRERLFRPFAQVHTGDRPPGEAGSGLGLFIARGLAEEHGGTLEVRSEGPGRGSAFVLALPSDPGAARDRPAHG